MVKSKLITMLRTFTKEEMKDFDKFISSPYFSKGRNLKPLYNILKKFHPFFDSPNLSEEKIFRKLYPKKKFEEKRSLRIVKVMLSDVSVLAEKFLLVEANNKGNQKILCDIHLLKVLNERKLDNAFMVNLKSINKLFEKEHDLDSGLLYLQMELKNNLCGFYLSHDRQMDTADDLLKQGEYLVSYFLVQFLNIRAYLETNRSVFNIDYDFNVVKEMMESINFEKILETMKSNSFEHYIVIAINYYSVMAQLNISDDAYYYKFKELFEENIDLFSKKEKNNLLLGLECCCWRRINKTDHPKSIKDFYKNELFGLYNLKLNNVMYISVNEKYMRLNTFRNIIMIALALKKYSWLESYINKYINKLDPEVRENMYNHSMGIVHFNKGNFEKSLHLMSKVKFKYFYLKVDVKNWMLLNYYELNMIEQVESLVDTYKHFLSKNKNITEEFKKINIGFLDHFLKLWKFKNGDKTLLLNKIYNDIVSLPSLQYKSWFLNKIKEFDDNSTNK